MMSEGDVFALVLAAVLIGAGIAAGVNSTVAKDKFVDKCEAAGGTPVQPMSGEWMCVRKDTVITL